MQLYFGDSIKQGNPQIYLFENHCVSDKLLEDRLSPLQGGWEAQEKP